MDDELIDPTLAAIAHELQDYPDPRFRARLRQQLERESMAKQVITPYVMTQDIEPLIAFVKQVFGAEEVRRSTGTAGGVHCELRIGDSIAMFGGNVPGKAVPPRVIAFHVYVDNVDAVYQRAMQAGATSMGEPAQMPYNERAGYISDPAGNHWYIATHTGPTYFSKKPRTITPSLHVKHAAGRGAEEFIAFLEAAFGADVEGRHAHEGQLRHVVMRIGGEALEFGTSSEWGMPAPAALVLNVADVDAAFARALKAGATSLSAPAVMPFGGRMGGVTDPWGNEWYFASA